MTEADDRLAKRTKLIARKEKVLLEYRPLNMWEDEHPDKLRVKYRRELDLELSRIQCELKGLAVG